MWIGFIWPMTWTGENGNKVSGSIQRISWLAEITISFPTTINFMALVCYIKWSGIFMNMGRVLFAYNTVNPSFFLTKQWILVINGIARYACRFRTILSRQETGWRVFHFAGNSVVPGPVTLLASFRCSGIRLQPCRTPRSVTRLKVVHSDSTHPLPYDTDEIYFNLLYISTVTQRRMLE